MHSKLPQAKAPRHSRKASKSSKENGEKHPQSKQWNSYRNNTRRPWLDHDQRHHQQEQAQLLEDTNQQLKRITQETTEHLRESQPPLVSRNSTAKTKIRTRRSRRTRPSQPSNKKEGTRRKKNKLPNKVTTTQQAYNAPENLKATTNAQHATQKRTWST